jgi:hypothetical protein
LNGKPTTFLVPISLLFCTYGSENSVAKRPIKAKEAPFGSGASCRKLVLEKGEHGESCLGRPLLIISESFFQHSACGEFLLKYRRNKQRKSVTMVPAHFVIYAIADQTISECL